MVVSKDAKKKRKESPMIDTSPEIPKRTKVQAQRKFAQGQSAPSASYTSGVASSSAAASTSQPGTPIRENREPPPELITHKRPRTEDFLTFLCYRGTSVLPSHLDFLNQNKNSSNKDENKEGVDGKEKEETKSNASTSKEKEVGQPKEETPEKKDQKKEIIPFAVRKRAEQVAEGNRKQKGERATRLRDKPNKKEDTNRRSPRTRGAKNDSTNDGIDEPSDASMEEIEEEEESPKEPEEKAKKPAVGKNKRKLNQKKNVEDKPPETVELIEKIGSTPSKETVTNKKLAVENKELEKDDSEEKGKKGKAKRTVTPIEPSGRMTRQRAFFEPVKVPRPEIEEKEETLEDNKVVEKKDQTKAKNEFSSDDEQPLAKTIKLTKSSPKKAAKGRKSAVAPKAKEKPKIALPDLEKESKSPTPASNPTPVTSPTRRILPRSKQAEKEAPVAAETASRKSDVSSKVSQGPIKAAQKRPAKAVEKDKDKDKEKDKVEAPSDDDTFGRISPKRRSKRKDNDLDPSQHSQTDVSENDLRTGRPTRKTKEAATIYMELIGQKLNLDGFDDDDSSMDSYPELPNAKKTQKLENDLKKNVEKPKPKPKAIKKPVKTQKKQVAKKSTAKVVTTEKEIVEKKPVAKVEEKSTKAEVVEQKGKDIKHKLLKVEAPKQMPKVEPVEKLEKSFSDSDDEPLATKVHKPNDSEKVEPKNEVVKLEDKPVPPIVAEAKPLVTPKQEKITPGTKVTAGNELKGSPPIQSPNKPQNKAAVNRAESSKPTSPTAFPSLADRFPSPKINPTFLTPKFDRNLERRVPVDSAQTSSSTSKLGFLPSPSPLKNDSIAKSSSPSNSANNSKKAEPETFLSANLMPSKEESGKIFGIASVSLAQSSGPDNTKCTLGKCGSIHKPVLGPVVPTEAYLGEQLSSKERRKAKVNMTHEQIQKWLIECSSNPDDIVDDLDDDFDAPAKPSSFAPTPPPIQDEKSNFSSFSKSTKDNVKTESVWSGKGPSLKATPVVVKEEQKRITPAPESVKHEESMDKIYEPTQKSRQLDSIKKEKEPVEPKKKATPPQKAVRESMKSPKPSTSSTATSSPKHQKASRVTKEEPAKKEVVSKQAQKRQPVYSSKMGDASKRKPSAINFSAFSPENETSVYSFDKEDDTPPPLTKPFRRHSRRESHNEDSQSEKPNNKEKMEKDKAAKADKTEKSGKMEKGAPKDVQQSSISVTLSPEDNNKLVKVSLDGDTAIKTTSPEKAQGNEMANLGDSDSEGQTFYIPLQGLRPAGAAGEKSSDVIQGVAVKLGREGPEGPNQRVIMHATLVTKAQMGSNTTPIPESMNVHEIVKSLLSTSKDSGTSIGSKSVPVGTVQPRFKSTRDQQDASGSGLTRVNSNSSLFSGSNKSRSASASAGPKKAKDDTPIKMCNNTAFPRRDDPPQMVEAPIFRPTEKEFQDPMEFIERITPIAARFGICKIIPPASFKPECRISDDMRFTAYNQYVHKMLHRWGPSAKELSAIKKYLATQSIAMAHPPWIGGMEVDLPRLYHTVQELGGLKEVIEKKKWARVAEEMCIPKLAQDRVTKLDDIYCKYLLPYDTLSPAERQKLFDEVEADWAKREARARRNADRCVNLESVSNEDEGSSDEDEESEEEVDGVSMECIVKGRNMPLSQFFRIARNTMALWFKNTEPTVSDIEAEFWRHVAVRDSHVCVHSGSIDSSGWGYGFPTPGPKAKGSPCARHPWNLKVLTNNTGSVLRSLGPVMGVTVPTLHVGMLFSACCWYRDPHGLSWIEYLHTGASKIWYGIPDEQSSSFRAALTALIPTHCQNKTIWLPCDTVMVPPHMLTDRNVSLCRTEQKPGEFVVVFPRAYTSSVASGYVVSESVYFATSSWLDSAKEDFKDIHESCEPAMFSLEQLLFAIASDQRVSPDILSQILPILSEVYEKEVAARQQLKAAGVTSTEKLQQSTGKPKQKFQVAEVYECDLCRANLYISMVRIEEGSIYCLQHALKNINNSNIQAKQCTLIFKYTVDEIEEMSKKLKDRLEQKKTPVIITGKKGHASK